MIDIEKKLYTKVCKYERCGKSYESTSRGQRYCSEECCQKANAERTALNNKRKRGRDIYHATRDIQKFMTNAYRLAKVTAELFDIPKCNCIYCKDKEHEEELHHKNSIIWDNSPSNLIYLCKKRHHLVHTKIPVFSMIDILTKSQASTNMGEEALLLINEIISDFEKSTGSSYVELINSEYLYKGDIR